MTPARLDLHGAARLHDAAHLLEILPDIDDMPTLNQQLSALRAEKEAARDPAYTAIMNRATEALAATDILDLVPKVGDRAPLFARPNLDGETVRLRSLLRKGPVVASFFRGRW